MERLNDLSNDLISLSLLIKKMINMNYEMNNGRFLTSKWTPEDDKVLEALKVVFYFKYIHPNSEQKQISTEWNDVFNYWWRNTAVGCEPLMANALLVDFCVLLRAFVGKEEFSEQIELFCLNMESKMPKEGSSADYAKRLSNLPIQVWRYNWDSEDREHIGPMAQNFHALFPKKGDVRGIPMNDEIGLLLNLVQAMQVELRELVAKVQRLEAAMPNLDKVLEEE